MHVTKNQDAVWSFIANALERSGVAMLMYVLESEGSSPGRQGFKMAVTGDGKMAGTIGGGIMEHKFVELAKVKIGDQSFGYALHRQLHEKESGINHSGMICSGRQVILLFKLEKQHLAVIRSIGESIEANGNEYLQIGPGGIGLVCQPSAGDYFFEWKDDSGFLYLERLGKKNVLHIIGGGHCSLALSKLVCNLDFIVNVYDDRKDLNTMEQNSYADAVTIIDSYEHTGNFIAEGSNVYVVIMTFGYRTDEQALRSLLGKSFRYIGMLGSRKKVEKLFSQFDEEGLPSALLNQVRSPIGIQVRSRTADEIAISIAAEIIAEKNKDLP